MTKFALSAMLGAALGLMWATVASADAPAKQTQADAQTWDLPGPPARAVAMDERDQPPGPPPDAEDRPPPPDRRGSADGDRRGPPPDRRGGPDGDRHGPPGPPRDDNSSFGPPDGRPGGGPPLPPPPLRWPRNGMEMRETDPELFNLVKEEADLDRQSHDLAQQFRRATGDQREKIKDLIVKTVNRHFDVRQQRRGSN